MVSHIPVEGRRGSSPGPLLVHGTSAGLGWQGLYSSSESVPPVSGRAPVGVDERIVVHRSTVDIRWREARRWHREHVVPGTVHLIPSETDYEVGFDEALETQTILMGREVLIEVASESVATDPSKISLRQAVYQAPTPQLLLFDSVCAAVTAQDSTSATYIEYAARAIAAQLLVAWRADRGEMAPVALPPRAGRSRTILRAIEFIRDNMSEKLTLKIIAQAAGVSVTTLCREFRIELGVAPHQALMDMRLKRAQELLKNSKSSLLDIAGQCGFWSQEHMTVSFRTHFGLTPGAYRKVVSG